MSLAQGCIRHTVFGSCDRVQSFLLIAREGRTAEIALINVVARCHATDMMIILRSIDASSGTIGMVLSCIL